MNNLNKTNNNNNNNKDNNSIIINQNSTYHKVPHGNSKILRNPSYNYNPIGATNVSYRIL